MSYYERYSGNAILSEMAQIGQFRNWPESESEGCYMYNIYINNKNIPVIPRKTDTPLTHIKYHPEYPENRNIWSIALINNFRNFPDETISLTHSMSPMVPEKSLESYHCHLIYPLSGGWAGGATSPAFRINTEMTT